MKNQSLDIQQMVQQAQAALKVVAHYHVVILTVIILGFLIFVVITVNNILSNTTDLVYEEEQKAKSIKTRFDDATITKINELRSRQENHSLQLPDGRRNPFRE